MTPRTGEAHVWLFALDRPAAEVERLYELLSTAERARAGPLPLGARKRRYAVRQGTVREILARYTGRRPEELELTRSPHGKPSLESGPPFSVSDSGELALVAVASCGVGVDVERVVDRPIARHSPLPLVRFYESWTAREAKAKATGAGLWGPSAEGTVHCTTIDAGTGFVATLATGERALSVRTRRWQNW